MRAHHHTIAAIIGLMLLASMGARAAPTPTSENPVAFPWEQSERKPDPAILYGRLPNGMTYMIEANKTPAGTGVVHMRVAAGSLMEHKGAQGLAHFVEHMAFKGSTNMPENELVKFLERNGFRFGADANAFTYANKTEYVLDLPKNDDASLDAALFMMRETAGNLLLNADAIEHERGVILGEERLRDNVNMHRLRKWDYRVYAGQRYPEYGSPIGLVSDINSMQKSDFEDFYHSWYRPENVTLMVVGDFDPKVVEARIKAKFSDWQAQGPAPAAIDYGVYKPKGVITFGYEEKNLIEGVGLSWIKPAETQADSTQRAIDRYHDAMIARTLNQRLAKLAQSSDAPFISASLDFYTVFKTSRNVSLSITPKPGKAREAFEQVYDALHQFLNTGITPEEIDTLQKISPVLRQNMINSYPTLSNNATMAALDSAMDNDIVPESLEQGLVAFDMAVAQINRDVLNQRLKTLFDGDGPVLSHTGESIKDFDETAMKASYDALVQKNVAVFASAARKPWPYGNFGPAVMPMSQSPVPELAYTHYVFPNGVKLNVKSTALTANQVLVRIDYAGGMARYSPTTTKPLFMAACSLLTGGGLGQLKPDEMRDTLSDKAVSTSCILGDRRLTFNGVTTKTDITTQMQILMAYATDPGLRDDAFERTLSILPETLKSMRANPSSVLSLNLNTILRPGDNRYDSTQIAHADQVKFEDIRQIFKDALTDTPITISIVGDISEDEAVAQVAKTFATLPPRPAHAAIAPDANVTAFPPDAHNYVFYHNGRRDQSISRIYWPLFDYYADIKRAQTAAILAGILNERVREDVRENQGAAYTAGAREVISHTITGYGYLWADATIKTGDDKLFRDSVQRIVADLKANPVSDDELARVKTPLLEAFDNSPKSNGFWLDILPEMSENSRALAAYLHTKEGLSAVTAKEVQDLAKAYLKDDTAIHVQVIPPEKKAQ